MTKQRTLPLAALTASLMAAIGCVSQTQPVPKAQDSAETGSTVEPESQGYAPRGNPRFLIWAQKEPSGTDLQRVQVVKGWTNRQGEALEEVIDVSCAGGATPKRGQSCQPPAFNPMTCDQVSEGSEQLYLVWEDEEFDPSKHAFYYLRVLEMPTCRWSAHDKNSRIQSPGPEDVVQERAWSSPIWYSPPSL